MQTLTDFIRTQAGEFMSRQIFEEYRKIKPSIRIDSVVTQLNNPARRNEIRKAKYGKRNVYISQNPDMSFSLSWTRFDEIAATGVAYASESKAMAQFLLLIQNDGSYLIQDFFARRYL